MPGNLLLRSQAEYAKCGQVTLSICLTMVMRQADQSCWRTTAGTRDLHIKVDPGVWYETPSSNSPGSSVTSQHATKVC